MANEAAVMLVNTIKAQLAGLARGIVGALNDGKVSPLEGMTLGMQGMTLATVVITTLQGADPAMRQEVLHVLEHGQMVMSD